MDTDNKGNNTPCQQQETLRLASLCGYDILDTPAEQEFDDLTALAADILDIPISIISFVARDRQWFKSRVGLEAPETPIEVSFCKHELYQQDLLVVPDATADPRFANNPLVTGELNVRFYAGAVIRSHDGYPLGRFCVLDTRPRDISAKQLNVLKVFAQQVTAQLEQRRLYQISEHARQELTRANDDLKHRDETKDQFLAMVSHELRNPLSPILMTLDKLKLTGPHGAGVDKDIDVIHRQSKHLARLVDDMLDASRVATGKISLDLKPVAVADVVQRSLEMIKKAATEKQQSVSAQLPEQAIWLQGDDVRLCQLIANLLTNAVRYSPNHSCINISAEQIDAEVAITVADNGQGIAPEFLDKIFETFVQAPSQGGNHSGGLGIGLSLCRHLANLHQGSISVHSEGLGKGSQFCVRLPALAMGSPTQTQAPAQSHDRYQPPIPDNKQYTARGTESLGR
ncbi:GAF domain-containing sensor histidine kinase [Halioxenophilus aromaticivorans]|uniref:histidine kinase n=1 Tax=Halioxenophilus aromaticivorans TaxID=1306992 RepID=A0AAV3U5N0_9ALTE